MENVKIENGVLRAPHGLELPVMKGKEFVGIAKVVNHVRDDEIQYCVVFSKTKELATKGVKKNYKEDVRLGLITVLECETFSVNELKGGVE